MSKVIIVICFFTLPFYSFSQDHSQMSLSWQSKQTINPDNSVVNENTILMLKGRENIQWKNTDGTIRKDMKVIEIVGVWPLDQGKEIRLEVIDAGKRGYILITKTNGIMNAEISIDYQLPQRYKLRLEVL